MSDLTTRPSTETASGDPSSNGNREAEVAAALAAAELGTRRRWWPPLLLGIALGAAATWLALNYLDSGGEESVGSAPDVDLAVAAVEQRDLMEEIEWEGTLGYGEVVTVTGVGGTVTGATAVGTIVDRGDVVARVDDEPVVVFFGGVPFWRNLSEGDIGDDVLVLEANLAALGYDPDQTVDVDRTFTANTELMVERWQDDVGLEVTGELDRGRAIVVEGPSSVVSVAELGSPATGDLVALAPRTAESDIVATADGTITGLADVGVEITHGSVLYLVDDVPVVAIVTLDPVSSILTSDTFTITELEQALSDTGYDPDGDISIDDAVTDATVAALGRWRADAGFPTLDGPAAADPAYYALVSAGRTVDTRAVDEGSTVIGGGPVLVLSVSRLSVVMTVDVSDADEFELEQVVEIVLADESTVDGVVTDVGAVRQATQAQEAPTVDITIGVAADGLEQELIEGSVTVISVGRAVIGATVVPTRALVSLAEGGFAVEKVGPDGTPVLIGIEIGTFDEGMVEVVEGDLAPDDEVLVPQ